MNYPNSGFCLEDLVYMINNIAKKEQIIGIGFPFNNKINFLDFANTDKYKKSQDVLQKELKKTFYKIEKKDYFNNLKDIGINKHNVKWDVYMKNQDEKISNTKLLNKSKYFKLANKINL